MPDRTINWGDSATEATYQTGDDDPAGGGNFVVARDTDGGVTLLEYDPAAGEWVSRGDVNLNGNDLSAGGVAASDQIKNATYATLGDVPTTLSEGSQVYVQDEDRIYVEDGT
jgi:hypothetical protein